MKITKEIKILGIVAIIMFISMIVCFNRSNAAEDKDIKVDLNNLKYTIDETETNIRSYATLTPFEEAYKANRLPTVYITEFLYDGVSTVKPYDLDDFTEKGKDAEIDALKLTVINVNTTGNIEFSGELKGGMIAVNTNEKSGNINLIFNNVKLDTDSKKAPAIFVYNKDITYTDCKVTIKTVKDTKNYIEGGKFKKVSLIGSDELDKYTTKYSGENKTNYTEFTNYYGVYTSEQIDNILFAKVQADSEDLQEGDPLYFYKGAGAISSDIDLYFEGEGYLEVTSKNKEGIETKGNLTFQGGTGDYKVFAEDDCLNTTTKSSTTTSSGKKARNTLTIDVNSLIAIVDSGEDADEGDAIDSNGTLTIKGGTILAIAHPGQDAGIDSENGTYINGGTVIATGDMLDPISEESDQNFLTLNFQTAVPENTLIVVVNSNNEVVCAYRTDRSYNNLVFSSPKLSNGTYSVFKNGNISGKVVDGVYSDVTGYANGTKLGYSQKGNNAGMPGGAPNNRENPNSNENRQEPPQKPDRDASELPAKPDGEVATANEPPQQPNENNNTNSTVSAENGNFEINGVSNQFGGVGEYTGTDNTSNNEEESDILNKIIRYQNIAIIFAIVIGLIVVSIILTMANKKKKV